MSDHAAAPKWPIEARCETCVYWRMQWIHEINGEWLGQGECSYLTPSVGCSVVVDKDHGCRAWEPRA